MTGGFDIVGYLLILAVALVAHEPWRWLGIFLGRSIAPTDEVFIWVRAVSTALIAAVVMRLVLFPAGTLADVPVLARVGAFAIALGGYFAGGRQLLVGILAGSVALVAALLLFPA